MTFALALGAFLQFCSILHWSTFIRDIFVLLPQLIVRTQTYFNIRVKQLRLAAAKKAEKEKAKKDAERKDGSS